MKFDRLPGHSFGLPQTTSGKSIESDLLLVCRDVMMCSVWGKIEAAREPIRRGEMLTSEHLCGALFCRIIEPMHGGMPPP